MIIHSDKIMDFFYMQDLIMLVDYYINNKNLSKLINCSYSNKYILKNIANYINTLDLYKVLIIIDNMDELQFYCGIPCPININFQGIHNGILNTFGNLVKDFNLSVVKNQKKY
jgi:hypothetical protein